MCKCNPELRTPYCDGPGCEKPQQSPAQIRPMELPIELALTRWSVVHLRWNEIGGIIPSLTAFLAGWCSRCIGASEPQEIGMFRDSYRAGWKEASEQLVIAGRESYRGKLDHAGNS
jgi:hypothetical protein